MKVAIVHDDLMYRGGAEQVVLSMLKAFPNADLFTLCYDPKNTYPEYKQYHVNTSWFQYIARNAKAMKYLFFPFGIWAMRSMHLKGYDVVIISTTFAAKHVSIDDNALIFNYTYTPFRLVWNPFSYTQYSNSKGIFRWLFNIVISNLKKSDIKATRNADYFLAMTEETSLRIKTAYGVDVSAIIEPDVKTANFYLSNTSEEYYLLVSRLEYYKKVDLAIEAFNTLGLKLIIVGNGTKINELKAMAKENIQFKQGLSNSQLADLYANCKGFIFPQHEDYGITPLEANASGRPVIAYGAGGVLHTMIPYEGDAEHSTAVFFNDQTVQALVNAVKRFQSLTFNPQFIRANAERFDEAIFVQKLQNFILEKYQSCKEDAAILPT